jgi:Fuc2NAc and GlcNAc transferase
MNMDYFTPIYYYWYAASFLASAVGMFFFKRVASKFILADINHRTLHKIPTPKGAGVVFSLIFVIFCVFFWINNLLTGDIALLLSSGGLIVALFGIYDDINDIKAVKKIIFQTVISIFSVIWLNGGPLYLLYEFPIYLSVAFTVFFLVWVMNAYNFMDGVDGIAVSGAIYASMSISILMLFSQGFSEIVKLLFLLTSVLLPFLFVNWPPAKFFMGDSGSMFLGYFFGVLFLYTVQLNYVSMWIWMVTFSYFIADTTFTQLSRLIIVKKWYLAHKSHAYQNFARVNSHAKTIYLLVCYQIVWVSPLIVWSYYNPDKEVIVALLSLLPGLFFSYKYGPIFSSK